MGNNDCCKPSKKPLGSSVLLVDNSQKEGNDPSNSSSKEYSYPSNNTMKGVNEDYNLKKDLPVEIIDCESSESNSSNPFGKIGLINSRIRYPDN